MNRNREFVLNADAYGRPSKGRKGGGGRGNHASPVRERINSRDYAGHERDHQSGGNHPPAPGIVESPRGGEVTSDRSRGGLRRNRAPRDKDIDFEDPIGGPHLSVSLVSSAHGSSSSVTPSSYAKKRFRREIIDDRMEELDSNGHPLPPGLWFSDPQPKIFGLPFPDEGFICSEINALTLSQAAVNACLVDRMVYRHESQGRMMEWMGRDLLYRQSQAFAISGQLLFAKQEVAVDRDAAWEKFREAYKELEELRSRYQALIEKHDAAKASVRHLEDGEAQSSSRLERAKAKMDEQERQIAELRQRSSSEDEVIDEWLNSEEGKSASAGLAPPSIKSGYHRALQYQLSEVPPESEWGGLPSPYTDIGLTDDSFPYYIEDDPPPATAAEGKEDEETPVVDP